MFTKQELEKYLQKCLSTGADFAEIFLEESNYKTIKLSDEVIQNVYSDYIKGIGIRICLKDKTVYGCTNNIQNIDNIITRLISNFSEKPIKKNINLQEKVIYKDDIKIPHNKYSITNKKNLLYNINAIARKESEKVNQVEVKLVEEDEKIIIANINNLYTEDNRTLTRLAITTFVKENDKIEKAYIAPGFKKGYEFIDDVNIEQMTKETVHNALEKLSAKECPSGEMPVIIGNGFGGVIFHEACVHSLEATSVAKGSSVFSNMLGKTIASPKVTIVDDGTLKHEWGSLNIDDEGAPTRRNILIKEGVLTSYLIDYINSKIMKSQPTSSGRRESYKFSPTSRMTNTFLLPGTDKIEDMISSIKYGLYAKNLGGGSVNTSTGDFNFAVNEAYLIENGHITTPVKGASLIGNGSEIIKRVSMVSDDLKLGTGMCGSISGNIPVTVGQPTIKVDKILVGGKGEKVNV